MKIAITYDALNEIDKDKLIDYIVKLQNNDGSFTGDNWGKT